MSAESLAACTGIGFARWGEVEEGVEDLLVDELYAVSEALELSEKELWAELDRALKVDRRLEPTERQRIVDTIVERLLRG